MVRCFLIHTVCPLSAADSRILYSRVFGPDEALFTNKNQDLDRDLDPEQDQDPEQDLDPEQGQNQNQDPDPDQRRVLQERSLSAVARRVLGAVSRARESSGRALAEAVPGEEALALQEADGGVVRLRAGEPFPRETSALWLGVQSLGFTLVCEPHENLPLAEGTLRTLARHCLEQLHMLGQGSEVLLRSNRIDALLARLLPHGQLLFLNHRFAQSLEKDAAAYMAK